ncbi:MAG: hypothetical protein COU65_04710 [Candidatus Pacebacteria bacterium CG10_big_fil_rev_8_21_14_0_10_42_12]|nr:MAG: hypothetical protein COU65_04710 [Candidatus Pacebacteria bacterium CG10_big_fil_rev_8_21_14_0_10_42_12]
MLKPNDLDKFLTLEMLTQVRIDDLVRETNKSLKRAILGARLEEFGQNIELTTTKTRFGGERYWFVCPKCERRAGILYRMDNAQLRCRLCVGKIYLAQKSGVE